MFDDYYLLMYSSTICILLIIKFVSACSFRWFIVAESTVRWFVVREKHCWMTADSAE
jgi:hypothetical protein